MIRFCSVTFAPLTSVVKSSSCAHSPLALVHARSHRALHPHTDISHFLRLQWLHHHHVYMTELISTDVLETNPRRPRLRTWNTHQQLCWTGHVSVIIPHLLGSGISSVSYHIKMVILADWPVFCILQVFVNGVSGGTDSPSPIVTSRTKDMQGAVMFGLSKS